MALTTTAEANACLGHLHDEPEQMQFIEDLKKRFPEFSEQLITDVTNKVYYLHTRFCARTTALL